MFHPIFDTNYTFTGHSLVPNSFEHSRLTIDSAALPSPETTEDSKKG